VRKYTHGVSCRTTENFRKDSELVKLPRCLILKSQQKFVHGDACKMYIVKLRYHLRVIVTVFQHTFLHRKCTSK